MSGLVYAGCVAAIVAGFALMLWLRREGDRHWKQVRPDRVRVTITLDFTRFNEAMRQASRSMQQLTRQRGTSPVSALPCKCNDQAHDPLTALWHRSYCAWYDHDRAGHRRRARVWGWVADRLVQVGDLLGWPGGAR